MNHWRRTHLAIYILAASLVVAAVVWYFPRPYIGQPLHSAVVRGDLAAVRRWATTSRINSPLWHPLPDRRVGYTPLMLAASVGDVAVAKELIDHGADVNSDLRSMTVLMVAASAGEVDTMTVLIGHGADVNATSGANETTLHYAARGRHAGAIRLLIEHGFDRSLMSLKSNDNLTPLEECLTRPGPVNGELVNAFGLTAADIRTTYDGQLVHMLDHPPADWSPEAVSTMLEVLQQKH